MMSQNDYLIIYQLVVSSCLRFDMSYIIYEKLCNLGKMTLRHLENMNFKLTLEGYIGILFILGITNRIFELCR